ncbi:HlyD family efflux transporter periplasmic adaptor subunit [Limibaculum sp. FT325]|uniref:HlyD family efflux transporter periplasmic adaptor subunit n=1 Tax=Thermohalobaculum sediminis TaxID=2939436 RepID=UPI0020C0212F|nr:HlyD family efflux transporter periplasmic adaptor subunit [Limibaculum sediminis]MCL5779239.1 HlyD family efflux transporter periplasmic adaptor subunit [Limibaculum sediminis]
MIPTPTFKAEDMHRGIATGLPLEIRRPAEQAGRRPARRRRPLALLLFGAACVAGAVFVMIGAPSLPADIARLLAGASAAGEHTGTAVTSALPVQTVLGLARLMPQGDLIRVSPPFGAGDARIAAILVSEGDRVAEGDLLATLDNAAALESARLAAEAAVAQRDAALAQVRETVRIGLLEARASVAEARAADDAARIRLNRARVLAARGVTTTATLDDLEAVAAQAAQALARAEATLARWNTGSVETQPDVVVAQAALDAANIDRERAIRDLAKSEVRAPVAGVVLDIEARPGERPGLDGLMTLGQTDSMMAQVEVFQTEIGRVREGQAVRLDAPPLAEVLTGRVERVGLLVGRQNLVSDDTAANTDARVVEVLVRLDPESSTSAAGLSNLEAVARIDTGSAE